MLHFRLQLILQCCLPTWAGSQLSKKPSSPPVRQLGSPTGKQAGR